jgi:surfactin synthase thioesterase subunit
MLEVLHHLPEPAMLVGWSLGGVIARELARFAPDLVRGVVTYGTPVIGGPTYTLAADAWGTDECDRIRRVSDALQHTVPIDVPITAMYSREDRMVSWAECIDHYTTACTHIEVSSSHVGMDPDVWSVVAQAIEA